MNLFLFHLPVQAHFSGNTYTAELSGPNGVFSGNYIGTLFNSSNSGTISASIPANTATGSGYRIRVISDNPAVTGTDNGSDLTINLPSISIAPTTPQSIGAGTDGAPLTVAETPQALSREWFYGTSPTGPYGTATGITTTSYTPNIAAPGTYYVVCVSTFDCDIVTSNAVQITVTESVTTGDITGTVFCSTVSDGSIIPVPFTSAGIFTGNTYTAQLSDASGDFGSPVNIGTLTSNLNTGIISATIPANTATGTGYRIRVTSSNPELTGTDNGTDLTINLSSNHISPTLTQNINAGVNGSTITVTETPAAVSREWFYGTISGGPYNATTTVTTTTYRPNFAVPGTYYVVCKSTFSCGTVISNQVQINVSGTVTTGAIIGSPFCVTAASGTSVSVPFTSIGTFSGNTYTAQLSNAAGSFTIVTPIGTLLSDANSGTISAIIPANTPTGTGYRIRVISSNPAVIGSSK